MSPPSFHEGSLSMEALPVPVLHFDAEGRLLRLNRRACDSLTVEPEAAVGRRPGDVVGCATAAREACGEGRACDGCALWQALEAALGGEIAVHREAVLPILGPEGAVRRIF
ncbi:MAG: hypothetical protein D6739_08300, partial [Nitrospirae bacterium]